MSSPARLRVGIIGVGKVGSVVGAALQSAGHPVVGVTAISEISRHRAAQYFPATDIVSMDQILELCDLVVVAIPDDHLESVIAGLAKTSGFRSGQIVVHLSGRHGLTVLEPAAAHGALVAAAHPAMTFAGTTHDLARLEGCPWAVTAVGDALLIAQALVLEMGGRPTVIDDELRIRYHAALSHASNHLVTLVHEVHETLRDIGIDDVHYAESLMTATLENAMVMHVDALTGPISRGDVATVAAHINAIRESHDLPSYRALAQSTISAALRARKISEETAQELRDIVA